MDRNSLIPWVDIETTGLDEQREMMCELAIVITDGFGNKVDEFQSLIFEPAWEGALVQGLHTAQAVVDMHRKSGLTQALVDKENALLEAGHTDRLPTLESVCWDAIAFLGFHGIGKDAIKLPMGGRSPQFDRRWIAYKMPELHDCFTHRDIDMSSFRAVCERVNKPLFDRIPPKNPAHRALNDLYDTIAEYQWYLDNFVFVA